jgi:hypothetical protein
MDIFTSLAIIALAALVHASFQLSVSVLTLLRSHAIGAKKSHSRTLSLTFGYVAGVGIMTLLVLTFLANIIQRLFGADAPAAVWAAVCGLLVGVGFAVWIFYYRREKGTSIWIPRSFARHLSDRSKATKDPAEAFSLGLTSVIAELLFTAAPMVISALVIVQLPTVWQPVGVALYTIISLFILFGIWVAVSAGHRMSEVQKWRETNKRFLQFASGSALAVLGGFVYVCKLMSEAAGII